MLKVLVTGANGMLGQDLCPILERNGYDVFRTNSKIMDITDYEAVCRVISENKPDIVVHCAAYTNVDKAEEDFETAKLVNSTGTENLAKVCAQKDITLVYVSTDYVFDGNKQSAYLPDDTPNPINNYGLTKFWGEEVIKKYCKKYFIARTSWLYGIHGKNFVETMILLASKPELKVVDDQTGCPTWTVELSNGIMKLLKTDEYGTYHVCGSGNTTWYGFAREIFNQCGLEVNLKPCTTNDFPRPAKRPYYSVMENSNICRDWKIALKDYLQERERIK